MAKRARQAADMPPEPVEGPWELPEGWRWGRLDDACRSTERGNPSSRFAGSFRYTDVGGVGDGVGAKTIAAEGAPSRARQFVRAGDTLFSNVRVALRRTIFAKPDMTDVASTAFSVLSPGDGLSARYLFRWMTTDYIVTSLLPLQRGSQPPAVLDSDVRAQPIPIPPLETQQRIVARIDELFTELDDAEAALARARADLGVWRKALLKSAVTGELTADWRAANPPTETGAELLARILTDRRTRWAADPKNKGKRFVEPLGPDTSALPELPEGWAWATTEMLTDGSRNAITIGPFGSDLKTSDYRDSGVPMIFVRHIRTSNFKGLRPQFVEPEKAERLSNHIARPGDILITKMGDPPGDAALYPVGMPDAVITADCIRWRASSALPTQYLRDWINSTAGSRWILSKTKGVAQQKITLELFRSMPVPVPPLAEATAAVRLLADVTESAIALQEVELEASVEAATLRQSILAAAFRGDLVQ